MRLLGLVAFPFTLLALCSLSLSPSRPLLPSFFPSQSSSRNLRQQPRRVWVGGKGSRGEGKFTIERKCARACLQPGENFHFLQELVWRLEARGRGAAGVEERERGREEEEEEEEEEEKN